MLGLSAARSAQRNLHLSRTDRTPSRVSLSGPTGLELDPNPGSTPEVTSPDPNLQGGANSWVQTQL